MKRTFFFILLILLSLLLVIPVTADQEGNANWCNIDEYGCYETSDDGSIYYIMFWSEPARQRIMGNLTAPYTNVVDYCNNCYTGKMGMGDGEDPIKNKWREELTDIYMKYTGTLFTETTVYKEIDSASKEIDRNIQSGKWKKSDVETHILNIKNDFAALGKKVGVEDDN